MGDFLLFLQDRSGFYLAASSDSYFLLVEQAESTQVARNKNRDHPFYGRPIPGGFAGMVAGRD
jgi:hypothetical protein